MVGDANRKITRVTVDRTRCFSHERCVLVAPAVFSTDDEGISTVGDIRLVSDETLRQAAEACPLQAIFIFEGDDNQVYPDPVQW